ncbi:MAG TPA: hypothetical protein VHW44_05165 [Pseudonocardiaceae bacterium]|jgi:hypothetical protein|nr:hypothetical protein [Pseudonocardiaceae bacterium]
MRRTSLLICGVAAGLAVLTACGTSTVSGDASPATPAASTGASTGTSTPGAGAVTTLAQLGQLVTENTGKQNTAHLTVQSSTGPISINATGVVRFGSPVAMHETITAGQLGQVEAILLDNSAYVQLPAALKQLSGGSAKPWFKVDPNGNDTLSKLLTPFLQTAEQNTDPAAIINMIKSSGTITATRSEQLNGQPTTHYTVAVDLRKLVDSLAPSDARRTTYAADLQAGVTAETVDMWVSPANLPIKIVSTTSIPNPAGSGPNLQVGVTTTYSDWGQPVIITAPPADQVGTAGH